MFEQAFKNIDNIVWKEAGCTTELDYTEQTSWVLFLKYLDGLETEKAMGPSSKTRNMNPSSKVNIAGKNGRCRKRPTARSTTTPRAPATT